MKRPIAVALTFVIFAAVAVCFLRPVPAPNNPDFGNVPRVCKPVDLQRVRDCEGDTDLLKIDAINWATSRQGVIKLNTTPAARLSMTSAQLHGNKLVYDRGDGLCEKLVNGEWVDVGELLVDWARPVLRMYDDLSGRQGCYLDPSVEDSEIYRSIAATMPEYEPGATYRLTYYFREMLSWDRYSDQLYSVSHTVKIPAPSDKRFDLITPGLEVYGDGSGIGRIVPVIRVNWGEAPYVQQHLCTVEKRQGSSWVQALNRFGEPAFVWRHEEDRIYKQMQARTLKQVSTDLDGEYYQIAISVSISVDDADALYRVTIPFTENLDGSGERYTLTLNLRFDG